MSEVQHEEALVERGGRDVLVRTFAVAEQQLDGRTLHVRVVPFGEVATVADPPHYRPYQEEFLPGVFRDQENAAHRVRLRSDHAAIDERTGQRMSGTAGIVGNGVRIREANGGVEGEFRFLETNEAETARQLVIERGFDGVSQEFVPKVSRRSKTGVMQRVKAHLDSVALALGPAYSGAEILGMREESARGEIIIDDEFMPPPVDRALLERCADLGIELPEGQALLLSRAYTDAPWDNDLSRWSSVEAYSAASAIDLNPIGAKKTMERCHLPYREPGSGTINIVAVREALDRIAQGDPPDATQVQRDDAKVTLERILNTYDQAR